MSNVRKNDMVGQYFQNINWFLYLIFHYPGSLPFTQDHSGLRIESRKYNGGFLPVLKPKALKKKKELGINKASGRKAPRSN